MVRPVGRHNLAVESMKAYADNRLRIKDKTRRNPLGRYLGPAAVAAGTLAAAGFPATGAAALVIGLAGLAVKGYLSQQRFEAAIKALQKAAKIKEQTETEITSLAVAAYQSSRPASSPAVLIRNGLSPAFEIGKALKELRANDPVAFGRLSERAPKTVAMFIAFADSNAQIFTSPPPPPAAPAPADEDTVIAQADAPPPPRIAVPPDDETTVITEVIQPPSANLAVEISTETAETTILDDKDEDRFYNPFTADPAKGKAEARRIFDETHSWRVKAKMAMLLGWLEEASFAALKPAKGIASITDQNWGNIIRHIALAAKKGDALALSIFESILADHSAVALHCLSAAKDLRGIIERSGEVDDRYILSIAAGLYGYLGQLGKVENEAIARLRADLRWIVDSPRYKQIRS